MVIDGTYLQLMPPQVIMGPDTISTNIVTPGTVTTLKGDTKIQALSTGANLSAGISILEKVEASVTESSADATRQGLATPGSQTAFEISRLEQNAKIVLGLAGKMIGFLVRDWGDLRMGDILQHLTVAQGSDISGGLKFASFILPNRTSEGKTKTRKIEFTDKIEPPKSKEEAMGMSYQVMKEEGGLNTDKEIVKVIPDIFRKLKYQVIVRPEIITPPSDALKKALNLELFDRAIQLPFANQEALYRDVLLSNYDTTKDDPDKYVAEQQSPTPQIPGATPTPQPSVVNKLFGTGQTGDLAKVAG